MVIVQNLEIRYVIRFKLQKNGPNFKVVSRFVFAYFTMFLITFYCASYSQEEVPENKIILQKYGVLQIKSHHHQIHYQI